MVPYHGQWEALISVAPLSRAYSRSELCGRLRLKEKENVRTHFVCRNWYNQSKHSPSISCSVKLLNVTRNGRGCCCFSGPLCSLQKSSKNWEKAAVSFSSLILSCSSKPQCVNNTEIGDVTSLCAQTTKRQTQI